MRTKILFAALATVCALALTAGPAAARSTTVVMNLVPSGDASASCPGSLFGLGFDVVSPAGKALGTGRSCVAAIDGCDPFRPRCHQAVSATFTLDLAPGSVTAPMTLHEIWPTESSFLQLGHGRVASGTGAYAAARGSIAGGGGGEFTDQGFDGRLVYLLRLEGVR